MKTEQETKDHIANVMDRLNPAQQRRVAKKLMREYSTKLGDLKVGRREKEIQLKELESLLEWSNQDLALERNDMSRMHKLNEAVAEGRLVIDEPDKVSGEHFWTEHTMVVCHDWYKVIGSVDDKEVRFPYDYFAFEFKINGRCVIAVCFDKDRLKPEVNHCNPLQFSAFVQAGDYWWPLREEADESPGTQDLIDYMWCQIKAICVSLDAEVAEVEPVRAPHKLNVKRAKRGRPPLQSYHVVELSKRHRTSSRSGGEGAKKRLHFRRGHWRHYDGFKTWVRWCLVGDPELGFVDKHYRM